MKKLIYITLLFGLMLLLDACSKENINPVNEQDPFSSEYVRGLEDNGGPCGSGGIVGNSDDDDVTNDDEDDDGIVDPGDDDEDDEEDKNKSKLKET